MRAMVVVLALALGGWSWIDQPVTEVEDGNRAFARGDFRAAAAAYEQALVEGTEPELLFNRGLALYRMALPLSGSQREDALGRAESALARAAGAPRPWLRSQALVGLGNIYIERGQLGQAIAAYRRSLASDPQNLVARQNLEIALRRKSEAEGDGDGGDQAGQPDPDGGDGPTETDPDDDRPPQGQEQQEGESGADQPAGPDGPEPEVAGDDAQRPGPPQNRAPEQRRDSEVADLDAKLESLERRSRSLRRELLGRSKDDSSGGVPW